MCEIMERYMEEARTEGKAEGKAEGLTEGMAKGRIENLQSVIKNLFRMNLPMDQIAKAVNLKEEEVREYLSQI